MGKELYEISKRIRGEVSRFYHARQRHFDNIPNVPLMMENVISAYMSAHRDVDYSHSLVYLCGPLALTIKKESEVYYAFEKVMDAQSTYLFLFTLVAEHFSTVSLSGRISNFLMLFMTLIPDVYRHFEDEEVDLKEFANSWFQTLLAKELPFECTLKCTIAGCSRFRCS